MVSLKLAVTVLLIAGASACAIHKKCGNGNWKFFGKTNACYKVVEDRLRFEEAEDACVKEGGHLTSIHSEEENKYVTDISRTIVKGGWTDMVWVGLRQVDEEFTWTDGTTPPKDSYNNWAWRQPDHLDEMCGNLFVSFDDTIDVPKLEEGQWNDNFCSKKMRAYICKKQLLTCKEGWKLYNNACYKVFPIKRIFASAESMCVDEGGHLASIHSEGENAMIADLAKTDTKGSWSNMVWFGLHQVDKVWKFTDGTSIGSYNNWAPKQPDVNVRPEDCGQLLVGMNETIPATIHGATETSWNNYGCGGNMRAFVCKITA